MTFTTWLAIAVLALLGLSAIRRLIPTGSNEGGVKAIDSSGLSDLLTTEKVQLVDVRTPQEFAGRSAKGFKNIPLQQLQERIGQLDPQRPIVVMCASGARSAQAARLLAKSGFTQVYNFSGGIAAYKK